MKRGATMKTLKNLQPYCLWGAYLLWLISFFLPHGFLGMDYPSAHITIIVLPTLGGGNLLLALLCRRWKSMIACLPLLLAFYIPWFVGSLLFGV